jgi:hypothetical protein
MDEIIRTLQTARVDWRATNDGPYLLEAIVGGRLVRVRLNDFPDEPLCAVMVEGWEADLEDWPETWRLPRHRGEVALGESS